MHTTYIAVEDAASHLNHPDWVFIDCRFSMDQPTLKEQEYGRSHLPGAHYAHLERDLSNPEQMGKAGRHPLPDFEALVSNFSKWGIDPTVQVVAYDDGSGAMAARLWWILRWMGHDAVAVLDGGWNAWNRAGLPLSAEIPEPSPRSFQMNPRHEWLLRANEVDAVRNRSEVCMIDARSRERFRGENETLDPVAGHIPGALSFPCTENLDAEGKVISVEALCRRFEQVLEGRSPDRLISYCGSGVTACLNLLALKHSGLGNGRLYAGSWSEWITDPARPVATGD